MEVKVELDELNKVIKDFKFRNGAMAMQIATKDEHIQQLERKLKQFSKDSYKYLEEVKDLKFKLSRCDNFTVTITDTEGNKNNFPDHTMD